MSSTDSRTGADHRSDVRWTRDIFFVFACIGAAAGLGSIWRFPYMAFDNGGAGFLLNYAVAMVVVGVPLVLLEIGLGVWARGSIAGATNRLGGAWTWVGWWALLNSFVIVFYYAVVVGWCVQYFLYAFTQSWQPDPKSFLFGQVLKISASPYDVGGFNLFGGLCLLAVWVSIFLIVRSGTKGLARVLMVTVPLPLVFLAVLAWRGLSLPGGWEGVQALFNPADANLKEVTPSKAWGAAASQVILAMSLGMGQMVAYASRKKDDGGLVRMGISICAGVAVFSLLAGIAVFSTAGYLAQLNGVGLKDLAINSLPLAFVTYPTAISTLPLAPIWGVTFFLLLILISIDSAFAVIEANLAGIQDLGIADARGKVAMLLCVAGFLGGLPFLTGAGLYWLDIVDHWVAQYSIVAIVFLECIIFALFSRGALSKILGVRRPWLVVAARVHIGIVIPALMLYSISGTFADDLAKPYSGYPPAALAIGGWGVAVATALLGVALGRVHNRRGARAESSAP